MTQHVEVTPELYRQIFEVDARGAAILEHLTTIFSKAAVTDGGIDAILKTYNNMGSTKVVQFIVGQINVANGVQPLEVELPSA